jgi:N-methylhydantoinase B
MKFDALRVILFTEMVSSIAEEMGSVLERVGFSPNIRERRDYSCALFDEGGRLIAQAAHIPVHLGAMEFLMQKWLKDGEYIPESGMGITNDPFFAGTHLPDISLIMPIDFKGKRIGYVANRAHHSDIGGEAPGSFAPVADVRQEGLLIKPQIFNEKIFNWILENTRNADERKGDINAQIAACETGKKRFLELAEKYEHEMAKMFNDCMDYAEGVSKSTVSDIPDGIYESEDYLELDNKDIKIKVKIKVHGESILFDFSGSDNQLNIGINATEAVTRSACYYIMRCLMPEAPTNGGCWRNIDVTIPDGSVLNAKFPAPVVAGNTETSQRIVDVILQALAKATPDKIPACSQGTMNNVALGNDNWTYYETIGGGAGAGPSRDGASAIHTHMTNTRNTPVEAMEIALPLRVKQWKLRNDSGGKGIHKGGDGIIKEIEILDDNVALSLMTERRRRQPCGMNGGENGKCGRNVLMRSNEEYELKPKTSFKVNKHDILHIETPGGGGWGKS